MSFKSFSSTLPAGKKSPATDAARVGPVHDQPAQPATPTDSAKPAPAAVNRA